MFTVPTRTSRSSTFLCHLTSPLHTSTLQPMTPLLAMPVILLRKLPFEGFDWLDLPLIEVDIFFCCYSCNVIGIRF